MSEPITEDDYRFARRRAQEGAGLAEIRGELAGRGVDAELIGHILRGIETEHSRRKPSVLFIAVGAAVLLLGAVFFWSNARRAFAGEAVTFRVPMLVCLAGGGLLARGLFR
jgi:hypothetical protein